MKILTKERPLFDALAAEEAKQQGLKQAADNKPALLRYARRLAEEAAEQLGEVSMDDVARALAEKGHSIFALGNTAGSVFRGKQWECVGSTKSTRVHSHGNTLKVWKLKK